jgi:hypothetical protein
MSVTGFSHAFVQLLCENLCQGLKRPNSETDYTNTNNDDDDNNNNNNNNNTRTFNNVPLTLVGRIPKE